MKTLGQLVTEQDFVAFVNSATELKARLEAGYQVEYRYKGAYIISQKRGREYVTVSAPTEAQAKADWEQLNERGYHYDFETMQRVTVPGRH